jgi:hypothetical protein
MAYMQSEAYKDRCFIEALKQFPDGLPPLVIKPRLYECQQAKLLQIVKLPAMPAVEAPAPNK